MTKKMTRRQALFVQEYLIDLNGSAAAKRAGFSAKSAGVQAAKLLAQPHIAQAVSVAMNERSERTQVDADRVLLELARIGFADVRRAARWGLRNVVTEDDTAPSAPSAPYVDFVESSELDDDTAAAIAEVAIVNGSPRVKMHSKTEALTQIGRHLGMFVDRTEHSVVGDLAATLKERRARAAKYRGMITSDDKG